MKPKIDKKTGPSPAKEKGPEAAEQLDLEAKLAAGKPQQKTPLSEAISNIDTTVIRAIMWEHHRGPIPENYVVGFKDGNRTNCTLDNLVCIPKAQTHTLRSEHENGFTVFERKIQPLRQETDANHA